MELFENYRDRAGDAYDEMFDGDELREVLGAHAYDAADRDEFYRALAALAALTLGARDQGILARVLIPSAAPDIFEILRLVLGWAWTYVIVAELIGSSSGIGHMIIDSQALLATGQIIFGIIVIGIIGLISDFLFKWANRRLFPWSLA